MFLQNGLQLKNQTVLYVSGEESEQQIKMRADRIGVLNENFYLLTETDTQTIFKEIKKLKLVRKNKNIYPFITPENIDEIMLCQIPGVSTATAISIIKNSILLQI